MSFGGCEFGVCSEFVVDVEGEGFGELGPISMGGCGVVVSYAQTVTPKTLL